MDGWTKLLSEGAQATGDLLMQIAEGVGEKLGQGLSMLAEGARNIGSTVANSARSIADDVKGAVASLTPNPTPSLVPNAPSQAVAAVVTPSRNFGDMLSGQSFSLGNTQDLSFAVASVDGHDFGNLAPPVTFNNQFLAQQQLQQQSMAMA